jgi:hypothetical protein
MTTYNGTSTTTQVGVSSSSTTAKDAMQATATGTTGARGLFASATTNDAVSATCSAPTHSGVYGVANGGGCGVCGTSNTTTPKYAGVVGTNTAGGTGVYGQTSGTVVSGAGAAVWGQNTSNGVGVYGNANGSGYGVYGIDLNGVVGFGNGGTGVTGHGVNGGIGVFAASDTGFGLYVDMGDAHITHNATVGGDLTVTGTLTAGTKDFRIEHPLDSNKWLRHSCVESSARKNVYDGKIVADANGQAQVQMPSYFEALNEDFCYQLTAVGASAPSLHVKQEVIQNMFVIAGANPGQKVCWQVTGTRKDATALANPLVVEEVKTK